MKRMILIVALSIYSSFAFGQMLRPQVFAHTNQLQVTSNNFTKHTFRCSGFLYGRTLKGLTESHYYSEIVYPHRSSFRVFFIRDFTDRYINAYHSIHCYRF